MRLIYFIGALASLHLMGCQSILEKEPVRSPAETTSAGESSQESDFSRTTLQNLQFIADVYIPEGSKMKPQDNQKKCQLVQLGPRQETLGYHPDGDFSYSLGFRILPRLVKANGVEHYGLSELGAASATERNSPITASSGLHFNLPLDREYGNIPNHSVADYDPNVADFGRHGWVYKDGSFSTFQTEVNDKKGSPVLITKISIEVDPYFREIRSISKEVRLGSGNEMDKNFSTLPLQARITCSNNTNAPVSRFPTKMVNPILQTSVL